MKCIIIFSLVKIKPKSFFNTMNTSNFLPNIADIEPINIFDPSHTSEEPSLNALFSCPDEYLDELLKSMSFDELSNESIVNMEYETMQEQGGVLNH